MTTNNDGEKVTFSPFNTSLSVVSNSNSNPSMEFGTRPSDIEMESINDDSSIDTPNSNNDFVRPTSIRKKSVNIIEDSPKLPVFSLPPAIIKTTKLCGYEMILPKEYWLLLALCFNFGYIDANSFERFQVFTAMMTGNMVQLAIFMSTKQYSTALYAFTTILSNCIAGVMVGGFLTDAFKSKSNDMAKTRQKALSVILFVDILACVSLQGLEYAQNSSGRNYRGTFRYLSLVISLAQVSYQLLIYQLK